MLCSSVKYLLYYLPYFMFVEYLICIYGILFLTPLMICIPCMLSLYMHSIHTPVLQLIVLIAYGIQTSYYTVYILNSTQYAPPHKMA